MPAPILTTNAGTSLAAAGSDFGTLIQGVGKAVGETQLQLASTSADTASVLAQTTVDLIAVQETDYDDNGNVSGGKTFIQKLPLIDFIDPVFYQWTRVRLQGTFSINEIATASEAKSTNYYHNEHSGQHGLLLIFGGGQSGASGGYSESTTTTTSDRANAVGRARMFAQLNPRRDVGVPKPTTVIQGPSLNIIQGDIQESPGGGAPPTSRTMSLLIQLRKLDGSAIAGKAISLETQGTPWSYADAAKTTTDAGGNLAIKLQRTFLTAPPDAPPVDTSPKQVIVTARLGLVSNSVTVTF